MRMNKIKVLGKDEIQKIHQTSLKLLETTGIIVESPEARQLFKENGASIEKRNDAFFVKIPEELITENIRKVPKKFNLYGPDGSFHFEVNTNHTIFSTYGAAVNVHDPSKRKGIRKSSLDDAIKHIRIVSDLKNISSSHVDVWPHDVPFTELHFHTLREWGRHSYKPYGMSCYGRTASKDMINISSIIVGGEDELMKRPRLLGVFNPTSPLRLTQLLLNGIFVFARYNQPLNITSASGAGSTAPVTLGGVLTQMNMEILPSIILTQLINPGAPVLYGSTNTIMDPSSGNMAYGSIEMGLITIATAQIAHFYDIPSKGSGALTDSKCFDIQNGYERFMTLFCAANAGHNYITCAGTYETTLSEAFELLIIDDELIGIIKRAMEGVRIDDEALASEEIEQVMNSKKNYLGTKHSVKNTRKEFFIPRISNRDRRRTWRKKGSLDMMQAAKERVEKILSTQKGPGLSHDVEEKLDAYFKIVTTRTLDEYRKLEGMDDSEKPTEISGVKLE
ncbi:MAG: hypothetical protein EU539_03530 [Promethearchaeota archaeon]|nr:MAG: hypothetical protein EU539_03530 [Candidatus Lokiarchaeota archaeon]